MSVVGRADFRIPASVVSSDVDGSMVLLNAASEQYYSLDQVGADIVTRVLAQPFEEAFNALARDYDVNVDVLRTDVGDLIDSLLAAGLLERAAP